MSTRLATTDVAAADVASVDVGVQRTCVEATDATSLGGVGSGHTTTAIARGGDISLDGSGHTGGLANSQGVAKTLCATGDLDFSVLREHKG